ncbi:MAG: PQQ-dependent sugar dehydrogenase [Solirubrobacterales bacterium]
MSTVTEALTDVLRRPVMFLLAGVAAVVLWACSDGAADGKPAAEAGATGSEQATASDTASAAISYSVRRYVRGAPQAVGLAFDTRGRLIYAEKDSGRIIRYSNGSKRVMATLNVSGGGEAGLLGLTSDSKNNVYAYYTSGSQGCPDPTGSGGGGGLDGHCVWRFKTTGGGRLTADGLVFSSNHPSDASNHVGGGLHIGPDGALYLSIGDLGENDDPNKGPGRAQDLSVPFGKILRLDPAGRNKGATGNPGNCGNVANSSQRPASDDRIWACGLRNTYQFAFDANKRMWGSEAGDSCDEINRIVAGVNYGWEPPRTDCSGSGAGRPILKVSGTPSGIAVPTSRSAGSWRNDVFYCLFVSGELVRYDQKTRKRAKLGRGGGQCGYDMIARGNKIYMSSGEDVFRLSIKR